MTEDEIYTHWAQWSENQDVRVISTGDALRFAKHISERTNDRACRIVYGLCGSDNVATRTVEAIRKHD